MPCCRKVERKVQEKIEEKQKLACQNVLTQTGNFFKETPEDSLQCLVDCDRIFYDDYHKAHNLKYPEDIMKILWTKFGPIIILEGDYWRQSYKTTINLVCCVARVEIQIEI